MPWNEHLRPYSSYLWREEMGKDILTSEHQLHEYDAAGRLSNLTLGTLKLAYSYGPGNRVVGTTVTDSGHDISVSTVLTFDDFGREVERAVSQQGQLLYRLSQSYEHTGIVTSRHLEGGGEGKTVRDESFEYDVHSRLTKFTCTADEAQMPTDEKEHPIQQQQFDLDDLDNIRSVTTTFSDGSQDLATYVYDNEDDAFQLTQITHTHPDFPSQTNLAYNANGCLTRDEEGKTLDYESHSRLKSVRDGSGRVMSQYDHDAAGRLVRQSIPGQPDTRLFYRGDQLIGIVSGGAQTSFLADHLGYWGQVSQADSNSNEAEAQLWVADGHGSILNRTGPDQKTLLQQSYNSYGHPPLLSTGTAIAFNGQYRDPVTGWYHLGNGYRTYNPVLRRFHVPDPGSPFSTGEINPYAYCAGDPINRIDPSGRFSFFSLQFDWGDLLKFVVGFVVSILVGVLTVGAGTAIAVGVDIAADVATDMAISPLADLAAGRKPSWKSVAVDALNGLFDGVLGELGGSLLSAGFKAATKFKTAIGRAGSYTVNDVVEHSFGKTLKEVVKEVFPTEVVSNVVEGLSEIDPFPETSGESHAGPSRSLSYGQQQRQIEASGIQVPSNICRQASVASDPIRPALLDRGFSVHPEYRRGSGPRSQGAVRSSVAQILNRPLQFAFGPAGSSQGK
ncbi:uncharacterized protein TRIREDRAFT_106660 [Trichoderma reesei QM6a]|uniref:Predicted protein n=2 Tax=Hypocrea jecorina TaxID=51453 RepID=G0RH04_HYPJQ|nr:uncharacterized protein TRIREDRAFT_106660 [Trichoderma reesei QM6a]EGR49660.1 predicted protein [Trichoderma reesei QM6a]